ncbi:class I SAM-dependent methyltransferase [Nonomuraea africana]|uniref:2-polyprenyl-3-methyl-5-hydroxy-6-metoxy-1, 4-benzoquinol methylase n=1 Tax=Nonomuraea africana TaxID=46171 RepID=A0ABR9KMG1_9ACTN|nr:class I SAM-dependent methyltransferase [Nonomuraea africana]MBE1563214.1 2-polyprenyl-3-methyl-5-hydroxy-6-metoxy-1,4-benzoquinol methylase [Nonomuraea africana]
MGFNHNDHYHRLLLRALPPEAKRALDVGSGTGTFARALAARGLEVDAVDPALAPPSGGGVRHLRADVTTMDLPTGHYDFVSCLASLHHMPFDTVTRLRDSLAPGGVLAVLGCYREATPADYAVSAAAVPVNALFRLAHLADRSASSAAAPVAPPSMTLREIREAAAVLLPGARIRRLLFWRYLMVWRSG